MNGDVPSTFGCLVDSCLGCSPCRQFEEQYCANGSVPTYGGETKYGRAGPDGKPTHGGYSDGMVINERFAYRVGRLEASSRC